MCAASRVCLVLLALVVPSLPSSAAVQADAIMDPPSDCPDGLLGASSHGGPFCAVVACSESRFHPRDCPADSLCERRRYCLRDRTSFAVSRGLTETVAIRACATASDCDAGDRCEEVDHCMPFTASRGGRIRIVGAALAAVCAIAAVVLLAWRRRAAPRK